MTEEYDKARALEALNAIALWDVPLENVLAQVARIAKALLGDVEVSVSLVRENNAVTVASTGELATGLDETQYGIGDGPCLTAAREGEEIAISDVTVEERWPEYMARARESGLGSSLSVPLPLPQQADAALNVYCLRPNGISEDDADLARAFASQAAAAVANAHLVDAATAAAAQMNEAMKSRATIEQAKGIVMATHRCSPDEAFARLVARSQGENRKLRDIAAELVEAAQNAT